MQHADASWGRCLEPGEWLATPLGRALAAQEAVVVRRLLGQCFGYHLVQLGGPCDGSMMEGSPVRHRIVLRADPPETPVQGVECVLGTPQALPFAASSVDVLLLVHVLEYSPDPHQLLREVDRVLIPEGHALVVGFNPWSLWGLWRLLLGWREEPPWCGRFIGARRLGDWLRVLGFAVDRPAYTMFRPPLPRVARWPVHGRLERMGAYFTPWLGGVYVLRACKRVEGLTPLELHWQRARVPAGAGAAEPSTRIAARRGLGRASR